MSLPLLGGTAMFACSLAFYYLSVLNIDHKKSSLLDLQPGPDAIEYFAQARMLAKGSLPLIKIGYDKFPSAFPPGYPALMVPWLKILPGRDAVLAPFRTNQTAGLLLLLSVFAFYLYLMMPLAGGIATLLLATLPGFFTFCRSSMSDATTWLFYVLAFMFAYLGLREEVRWKVYLSAVLLGLSMNFRLQSVFFGPLLLAMPLFPAKEGFWRWFWHCSVAGLLFLLAASPFLVLNFIEFRSPFKMGGDFWYPQRQLFALDFIPTKNVAMFWRELTLNPIDYHAANIFGTGTVFVPAFALLTLSGLFFLRFNRATACLLIADLTFAVLTASYFYPDGRYYLQLLILLIPIAVLPVVWAFKNLFRAKEAVAAAGVLLLFAAACLGYPSRSGYHQPRVNRLQAWDAFHFYGWQKHSRWRNVEGRFAREYRKEPGIVFSDIDPVYLNALLPDAFAAAPIDDKQGRRWSPTWRYGRPQAAALAKDGLDRSIPVYALCISPRDTAKALSRLPKFDGYQWVKMPTRGSEVVLKLVPVGS